MQQRYVRNLGIGAVTAIALLAGVPTMATSGETASAVGEAASAVGNAASGNASAPVSSGGGDASAPVMSTPDDPSAPIRAAAAEAAAPVAAASQNSGKGRLNALIATHARKQGVPVALARAVVRIESNYNPRARGRAGEIGLMQIKLATARGVGFTGKTPALYDPETNLKWGMNYLGTAYKLAGGSVCGTILRYNAGHYAKRMNPVSRRYCRKVLALMGKDGDGAKES